MRPPLVSDELIRSAIREVGASGGRLTGVAVRDLLARRHGVRGGVSRIYRLLHTAQRPPPPRPTPVPAPTGETLEAAVERANLAEHREQTHQARWARETDALRARVVESERAARELADARLRIAELARALATAQQRIAALEALQPEEGSR
jgi:hypothetical protein